MAAAAPSMVSLKLFIDKKTKKVLFAEAGKETVDFLCNILTLPVGTVIRLLDKEGMVGCLSNLYKSIDSLNDGYIQPNENKDTVLKPMASTACFQSNSVVRQFLTYAPQEQKKFYRCDDGHAYVSEKRGIPCPTCSSYSRNSQLMIHEVKVVNANPAVKSAGSGGGEGGLVKGMIKYMVMDDLVVAPLSTTTLLEKFNVTNVGFLEEKVVGLDMDKALKLLKVSLYSNLVLTSVFCEDFIVQKC